MSISRHLLLKSVMLHLWPYKCFFLVCLVYLFKLEGTRGNVTLVVTILISTTVFMSPSFLMRFRHHLDFSKNLASAIDGVIIILS